MNIRHADPRHDSEACAAIYEPFVRGSAVSFEDVPPSPQEMAARIERVSQTHPFLVADDADAIVGYAYATHHRDRAGYRWACDVTVYVASFHQRKGVGRALYRSLLELLARQGLQVACAGITLPNDASVALHEACGFTQVGVYRRIGWKAGAWRDVAWWQLDLAPAEAGPPHEPGPPPRLA